MLGTQIKIVTSFLGPWNLSKCTLLTIADSGWTHKIYPRLPLFTDRQCFYQGWCVQSRGTSRNLPRSVQNTLPHWNTHWISITCCGSHTVRITEELLPWSPSIACCWKNSPCYPDVSQVSSTHLMAKLHHISRSAVCATDSCFSFYGNRFIIWTSKQWYQHITRDAFHSSRGARTTTSKENKKGIQDM